MILIIYEMVFLLSLKILKGIMQNFLEKQKRRFIERTNNQINTKELEGILDKNNSNIMRTPLKIDTRVRSLRSYLDEFEKGAFQVPSF